MNATLTADMPGKWGHDLHFVQSESKAVGIGGDLMDKIRDNAPRIVGGLKMAGDLTAALTLNPFLIGYSAFSLVGRVILMTWGTKANQKQMADEQSQKNDEDKASSIQTSIVGKVMHPRQYPVESSAGLSTIAELFETGFGVQQFMSGKTGFTATIMGLLSVYSYANILFSKEKKNSTEAMQGDDSQSLNFAESKSAPVGIIGRIRNAMKDNPVLVSSTLQVACSVGMLIGGFLEGYGAIYLAYNTLGLLGNLVQAMFVRKNEFNIEGAVADDGIIPGKAEDDTAFRRRLTQTRRNDTGLQPT